MKTMLLAGIVGVILFAASASVSWFLLNQNEPPKVVSEETPDVETEAGVPPIGRGFEKPEQLPVAMRPDARLSVEAVLELSESIRRKEQDLIAREKAVEKTEQNLRMLFEDLKIERAELNAMMDTIEAKLQLAQHAVSEVKLENQALSMQTQESSRNQPGSSTRPGATGADGEVLNQRVQTAKPWFEGLEDEQAANYLKEFANNGDLKFAARLLKSLPQRKASKILAAFNDPDFVQQILDALAEESKQEERQSASGASRQWGTGSIR